MGFRIGFGKAQWVITSDASKAALECITSAESINGVSHTIPAFLILQGKHTHNNSIHKISFSTSDSGHFEKHSAKRQMALSSPYHGHLWLASDL